MGEEWNNLQRSDCTAVTLIPVSSAPRAWEPRQYGIFIHLLSLFPKELPRTF